jgi:hypothetical protein
MAQRSVPALGEETRDQGIRMDLVVSHKLSITVAQMGVIVITGDHKDDWEIKRMADEARTSGGF